MAKITNLTAGLIWFAIATLFNVFMIPWVTDLIEGATTDTVMITASYVFIVIWVIYSNIVAPIQLSTEDTVAQ